MKKISQNPSEEILEQPIANLSKALKIDDLYDPSAKRRVLLFGELLKGFREKNKLTLREVQRLVGISNSFLSQIESGDRGFPTMKVLERLGAAYGTTAIGLLQAYEKAEKKIVPEADPDEKFVSDNYRQLSMADRQMFASWLRFRLNELRQDALKSRLTPKR